jgi:DNA modification methylase
VDLIQENKMQLIHGDCLEKMKDIPDKSVDMILCDLPYGTTQNKWDSVIPFDLYDPIKPLDLQPSGSNHCKNNVYLD